MQYDETQQRVLKLDIRRHARVLGAAGTGKTLLLVQLVTQWLTSKTFTTDEVVVLAHHRQEAARLRDEVERALPISVSGTLVRTPTSLALMICNAERQRTGAPLLQLMMGSRQDEVIRTAIEQLSEQGFPGVESEVLQSVPFRTELRDLWRVIDEFVMEPLGLAEYAQTLLADTQQSEHVHRLAERWVVASRIVHEAQRIARDRYPTERPANSIMRNAVTLLEHDDAWRSHSVLPRMLVVDDAADLEEGSLPLLATLANHGTRVWVFGDPDTSTATFQGEQSRVLAGLHQELARRGAHPSAIREDEQVVVLDRVYRHGTKLRTFVRELSERVGTAGGWEQRSATSVTDHDTTVEFTSVHTLSEQVGVIAYRLRHRHLGLSPEGGVVPWHHMAVICRSREQAMQVASSLEALDVPTTAPSGGMVLGHSGLVRHYLRLLQDALDIAPLSGSEVTELLISPIGGLDPISLRRLEHALVLTDRRQAFESSREPLSLSELLLSHIENPEHIPDLAEGRALARLSRVVTAARRTHRVGGTPRETLWALWDTSGQNELLSARAQSTPGALWAQANHDLDAVMELFFVLQRHEEQTSEVPIADVIEEVLTSEVPQDSLAMRSARSAVTVTTPQGAASEEFRVVCIAGPQEGAWPNLRSRGSLVGARSLQSLLRGGVADPFDRTQTLHEELRLFLSACSRATHELLVVAREDEEEFPSTFFHLGAPHLTDGLPNITLTLRGYIAELRRRLLQNPENTEASAALAYLAEEGVPGASPEEWYGMRPPSTMAPLVHLEDETARVNVSPSAIEVAEECPLNWFASTHSADPGNISANLGTLVHHALEAAETGSELELREIVDAEWKHLEFEAEWEESMHRDNTYRMVEGLAEYMRETRASGKQLFASEARFTLVVGRATLRGVADRIELVPNESGELVPRIVDLKTGRKVPSKNEIADHAQLLAYQLGLQESEFSYADPEAGEDPRTHHFGASSGAVLLFVHPKATTQKNSYRAVEQVALTPEKRAEFVERVSQVAQVMAAQNFEARVEHHCTSDQNFGACKLHIIPAVSYE